MWGCQPSLDLLCISAICVLSRYKKLKRLAFISSHNIPNSHFPRECLYIASILRVGQWVSDVKRG